MHTYTRRAALQMAAAPLLAASAPKHIVFVSGDEEYRSEQALPQLAKILATHHRFRTTVLYAIDPATGTINPDNTANIPGLEALDKADLVVMLLRFRNLPDEQMKHIVNYVEAGRPIVALRTSTHAFNIKQGAYQHWSWNSKQWDGGFGRQVLGETWVRHWGKHKFESTRGVFAPGAEKHPILRDIKSGEIWGPTDVYEVRLPLPADCAPLVMGQVLTGMNPTDPPLEGPKNNPMMPVAWTKTYKGGRVFTTTMGAANDLDNAPLRRLIVNACYWAMGLEKKIPKAAKVDLVGEYKGLPYGVGGWTKGQKPE